MNNTQRIWRIKQSAELKTLDIYIYGYVEGDSEDAFTGEKKKSKTSADYFKEELEKHPDVTNINLYVNSWGGDVFEGTAIRTLLKRHPAYATGYVDGFACSVASYILTACDKVIMPRNTMQFIHNIWTVTIGDANDHRKAADDLDQMMKANRQAYLEKSKGKLTEKKLIEMLDAGTWLTADECKTYGLCDMVLNKDVDLSEAKQMLQKVRMSRQFISQKNKKLAAQIDVLINSYSRTEVNKPLKFLLSLGEHNRQLKNSDLVKSLKLDLDEFKKLLLSSFKERGN